MKLSRVLGNSIKISKVSNNRNDLIPWARSQPIPSALTFHERNLGSMCGSGHWGRGRKSSFQGCSRVPSLQQTPREPHGCSLGWGCPSAIKRQLRFSNSFKDEFLKTHLPRVDLDTALSSFLLTHTSLNTTVYACHVSPITFFPKDKLLKMPEFRALVPIYIVEFPGLLI